MNLKKQLRLYLEEKAITAAQLSRKTGVSKQVISSWLGGSSPRNLEQVKKISDFFEISIDHLVYGNGIKTQRQQEPQDELSRFIADEWTGKFEISVKRLKDDN